MNSKGTTHYTSYLFFGYLLDTDCAARLYNNVLTEKQCDREELIFDDVEEAVGIMCYDKPQLKGLEVIKLYEDNDPEEPLGFFYKKYAIGFLLSQADCKTTVGLSYDYISEVVKGKGNLMAGVLKDLTSIEGKVVLGEPFIWLKSNHTLCS